MKQTKLTYLICLLTYLQVVVSVRVNINNYSAYALTDAHDRPFPIWPVLGMQHCHELRNHPATGLATSVYRVTRSGTIKDVDAQLYWARPAGESGDPGENDRCDQTERAQRRRRGRFINPVDSRMEMLVMWSNHLMTRIPLYDIMCDGKLGVCRYCLTFGEFPRRIQQDGKSE